MKGTSCSNWNIYNHFVGCCTYNICVKYEMFNVEAVNVNEHFTESSLLHCGESCDRALGLKIMKKYFSASPVIADSKHIKHAWII